MRSVVKRTPLRGYVITPYASEIDKHHLSSLNLIHVPGTLKDFAEWLAHEMPKRPSGWDLATARRPELRNIHGALTDTQKRALNSVTLVSADSLPRTETDATLGAIREFYKGFKPRWADILDGVPAQLSFINDFSKLVEDGHESRKCIALVGPAGSGKSTALMVAALHVSKTSNIPVYFLREAVSNREPPPPKGGGFRLRLKAGSVRPAADWQLAHSRAAISRPPSRPRKCQVHRGPASQIPKIMQA
jgi:hypothetical protein